MAPHKLIAHLPDRQRQIKVVSSMIEIGQDIVHLALEVNPANILTPGVTIKAAADRVDGDLTMRGIEVDPGRVGAPGVAGEVAAAVAVDAVVVGGDGGEGMRRT